MVVFNQSTEAESDYSMSVTTYLLKECVTKEESVYFFYFFKRLLLWSSETFPQANDTKCISMAKMSASSKMRSNSPVRTYNLTSAYA